MCLTRGDPDEVVFCEANERLEPVIYIAANFALTAWMLSCENPIS